MRFLSRDDTEITSLEEWGQLGKPASDHHWKPGRSAYELAADWIERGADARMRALLEAGGLAPVELIEGTAEKRTHFDDNPRGPRNHDLLVRARYAAEPLVIAVEGKADEPFDKPLWRWRSDALRKSPESGAPKRLDDLTQLFFGTTIDKDRDWPAIACVGYQLLSALAGTLADARIEQAPRAVLVIHEFRTEETEDERHQVNARVLDDFLTRLHPTSHTRIDTADGWITEPVIVRGDGKHLPAQTPVQIAKLVTNLRSETPASAPGTS
jgi:hypothetical protein